MGGRETVFCRPFFADITPGAERTRFWTQMKATRRQKKRIVVAHKPARALTRPVRSQVHVRSHAPQKKTTLNLFLALCLISAFDLFLFKRNQIVQQISRNPK